MKILYFDCFSGISGDMTLGALIDLGIDKDMFINELNKLKLDGYEINIQKKLINGITVTDVDVVLTNSHHHEHNHHSCNDHKHEHDHQHPHPHEHHGHSHEHLHDEAFVKTKPHEHTHDSRNLVDINKLIDESTLNNKVKEFSKKVFLEIAAAEAKVHSKSVEEVHFHEVGAIDSIVDIVGAAICLDLLDVDIVYSSPLHDGKGFIKCQHGLMPVPVPAVMEMLKGSDIPLISEDVNTELITPTGMGIIKSLAEKYDKMPRIKIDKVGYGAGKRDTGRFNALRVVMGTLMEKHDTNDEVVIIETNIDDMSSEILGFVMEKLFDNGALDVFFTPIYMKKNRPGTMMTVIADKDKEEQLADIILRETSTLGIRKYYSGRICMNRTFKKVETEFGEIGVKVATYGEIKKASPEYEDCKSIAKKSGLTLKEVYEMALKRI